MFSNGEFVARRQNPYFRATRITSTQAITYGSNQLITFNNKVVETGPGTQFNASTGVFTCSRPGYWMFSLLASLVVGGTATSQRLLSYLRLNATEFYFPDNSNAAPPNAGNNIFGGNMPLILSVGDTVQPGVLLLGAGLSSAAFDLSGTTTRGFHGVLLAT